MTSTLEKTYAEAKPEKESGSYAKERGDANRQLYKNRREARKRERAIL